MIVCVCNPRILEAEKKIKKLRATPRKHSEFKNSYQIKHKLKRIGMP